MQHTDTVDAPLMHEVARRWQAFAREGRRQRRQQKALNVDKDNRNTLITTDNIGWTSHAEEWHGKGYTRWDFNGTAPSVERR